MMDKKELKKKYKETIPSMGVFRILNTTSGKIFIGSSTNVKGKINSIRFQLEHGSFVNTALQNDYNEFGAGCFVFDVLDYLDPKEEPGYDYNRDLKALEQLWIERLGPFGEKGYNR